MFLLELAICKKHYKRGSLAELYSEVVTVNIESE